MPRGGRTSSRSPTRSATYTQAPIRTQQAAPVAAPSKGGMFSGLGGVLMQGMAFGAGSEVAHQAIRGITGSGNHPQQVIVQQAPPQAMPQQSFNKCQFENDSFVNCLKMNGDSLSQCQSYFNMLKDCEKH
jgi:predicted lipid-binding transport protein (Tim44 family)